jgi:hypothetical protein
MVPTYTYIFIFLIWQQSNFLMYYIEWQRIHYTDMHMCVCVAIETLIQSHPFSSFMTGLKWVTQCVALGVCYYLFRVPKLTTSFRGIHVAQSLVFWVVFCELLFVFLSFYPLAIVPSSLINSCGHCPFLFD